MTETMFHGFSGGRKAKWKVVNQGGGSVRSAGATLVVHPQVYTSYPLDVYFQ